ncbi:MAG: class I SAM-dependent methyltransferase [Pyrinomonadaceae bacterium]
MSDGNSDSTLRTCPGCASTKGRRRGAKHNFDMMITCEACGTLYVQRLPPASDVMDYDAYYTATNLSVSDFINQRVEEIVAGFAAYRNTNRLLEIGFGSGAMLGAAANAGWEAEGVEISRTATEHVREKGFKVFCGNLADADYPSAYFDVVIASELLEHVPEPRQLASEVARILRPGGLFWATTPHINGLSARLLGMDWTTVGPDHLHLFSQKGVTDLLTNAGFRRIRLDTHGVNPFELWQALVHHDEFVNTDTNAAINARVNSGCHLNETLGKSRPRRAVKKLVNELLRLSRLGDSLKIWAEL